jgi:RNA polymerase sigma factor (sigma-70 family)
MLAIDNAIKSLPRRLKEVFEAKHIHGYRAKEIAEQTGLSDQTIKGYLSEAMILLRAQLIIYVK